MSPGGVSVMAPVFGRVGERVVAYLEQLGRIEGTIVRSNDSGFAMAINATPRKRDKFALSSLGLPTGTFSIRRRAERMSASSRSDRKLPWCWPTARIGRGRVEQHQAAGQCVGSDRPSRRSRCA